MAGIRMQQDVPDRGRLQVWVNTRLQGRPIAGAKVSVSYSGDPGNVLEEVRTDSDGRSPVLDLPTPPVEYSLEPNVNQPYSEYTVKVEAEGYSPVEVTGSELLSGQSSVQPVEMDELTPDAFQDIAIPDTAKDYYVRYRDYIKNVACSEIYATWTDAAIRANVLAIMSFTLNRVYTEWYRNQYKFGSAGF